MIRRRSLVVLIACLAAAGAAPRAAGGEVFDEQALAFLRRVDADALSLLGVQHGGRLAVLDTIARDQLERMYGSAGVEGLPPAVAYLELYLLAGRYVDRPVLHVRERSMRDFVRQELDADAGATFARTWRLPPASLLDAEAWQLLIQSGRARREDFQRAEGVASLRDALPRLSERKEFRVAIDRLSERYFGFLATDLVRVVPRPTGAWRPLEEALARAAQSQSQPDGGIAAAWVTLGDAWRARDADGVNRAIARLDGLLAEQVKGYPSLTARRLERLYNRTRQFTVVWVGFAASLAALVLAAATGRRRARWAGLGLFALSTAMLLAAFVVRWVISGRAWYLPPIMNQFEAVTGSALLGAVLAFVLELIWKRSYFALAAALYATVALLSGLIFPEQMGAGIRAQHGILSSPVMAAHVTVIIVGHALAGMTFFISYAYLAITAARQRPTGQQASLLGGQFLAWTAILALLYAAFRTVSGEQAGVFRAALAAAAVLLVLLVGALAVLAGLRAGRLPGPISAAPDLRAWPADDTSAAVDRCNLIVAQLACWTIVVGTILGAYWGDFAWGRWWGWDPKETWALITALVYVALLHLRFVVPTRWRGLVTALVCILGCAVMLFNWVVVNYVLSGKHSYA